MLCRSPVTDPKVLAIYTGPGTHDPAWGDWQTFEAWALASGYQDGLTIDRIDNSGGYWPSNCRWATPLEQSRNKTNNVYIEVNGARMTLSQASAEFGPSACTIGKRIRSGWPPEQAVQKMNSRVAAKVYALYG